ncbi:MULTISPECIES: hypothetical protein [unclassified Rickettsia]|uniref:hypothetical protein n=1 Tax=unclassified Rickettsia TaxID=114295 RepID=UPI003132C334
MVITSMVSSSCFAKILSHATKPEGGNDIRHFFRAVQQGFWSLAMTIFIGYNYDQTNKTKFIANLISFANTDRNYLVYS